MRNLAPELEVGLEDATAEEVLEHMLDRHHPELALACSFQKEEAVLIDMLMRIEPSARVFTIDTGVLFPETYEAWREIERHYGVAVEIFDAQRDDGREWNALQCCSVAKVDALERALDGLCGWITGLRRDQSPTRADAPKVSYDEKRGLWKANPLADWDDKAVWNYIHRHGVPYNPLHDRGYESIGCVPCTLPGSGREGRWAGSDKTECGIHV
ncbi:MAG TPA: phosphoadenylyl-sulfate reductase [Solirubrobacteraceae bacterium]|nr:phosphoadenylyl-sulfate reductase [Solirubrobacteraceae bacterium]